MSVAERVNIICLSGVFGEWREKGFAHTPPPEYNKKENMPKFVHPVAILASLECYGAGLHTLYV